MTYNSRLSRSDHFYIVFRIISYKNPSLKGGELKEFRG
jgi:hypothetical protein